MGTLGMFQKQKGGQSGHYAGKGDGGGMNWEAGINTRTLLCTKQITSENLLYARGTLLHALR